MSAKKRNYLQISFPDNTYHKRIERIGKYLEGGSCNLSDKRERIILTAVILEMIHAMEHEMDGWIPDDEDEAQS